MESNTITKSRTPSGITTDIESQSVTSSSPSNNGFFTTDGKNNYTKIGLTIILLLFLVSIFFLI